MEVDDGWEGGDVGWGVTFEGREVEHVGAEEGLELGGAKVRGFELVGEGDGGVAHAPLPEARGES